MRAYRLPENSGTSEVIFGKLNGIRTEVVLTLMVIFASIDAGVRRGIYTYILSDNYTEKVCNHATTL